MSNPIVPATRGHEDQTSGSGNQTPEASFVSKPGIAAALFGVVLHLTSEQVFKPKSALDHLAHGKTIAGYEQDTSLSRVAEVAIGDLSVALQVVKNELIESKGESLGAALVAGVPMAEYLRSLKKKIVEEEYLFIMDHVRPIVEHLEIIQNELLSRDNPGKHVATQLED